MGNELEKIKEQLRQGLRVAEDGVELVELWSYVISVTQRLLQVADNKDIPEEERIMLIKAETADIVKLLKDDLERHGFDEDAS